MRVSQQVYDLAKELYTLSLRVDELEAGREELLKVKALQSKALVFAMGELDMTIEEMLDTASRVEKEALFTDLEDVLPTPDEMQQLSIQDSESLTEAQMHYYYAPSPNPRNY